MAAGIIYDTGALLAAERGDARLWLVHRRALQRGVVPVIPAPVLAQAWRGSDQANLSRLLLGCRVEPLDEDLARAVGVALRRSGTADLVDGCVVILALVRQDVAVTSDRGDLTRIAQGLGRRLAILDG